MLLAAVSHDIADAGWCEAWEALLVEMADQFWSNGIADELWTCSQALLDAGRHLPDVAVGLLRRSALDNNWPPECVTPVLTRLHEPVLNPGEPWADALLTDLPSLAEPWPDLIDHALLAPGPPLRTSLTGTAIRALARVPQRRGHPELERLSVRARHKVTQRQIREALIA